MASQQIVCEWLWRRHVARLSASAGWHFNWWCQWASLSGLWQKQPRIHWHLLPTSLKFHFYFTVCIIFQSNVFGIQYLFLLFPRLWSLQNPTYMDTFSESEASDDDAADSDGSESSSSFSGSSQSSSSTINQKGQWFLQGNLSRKF